MEVALTCHSGGKGLGGGLDSHIELDGARAARIRDVGKAHIAGRHAIASSLAHGLLEQVLLLCAEFGLAQGQLDPEVDLVRVRLLGAPGARPGLVRRVLGRFRRGLISDGAVDDSVGGEMCDVDRTRAAVKLAL